MSIKTHFIQLCSIVTKTVNRNIKKLSCKLCLTMEFFVTIAPANLLMSFIEVTSTVISNEINSLIGPLK